MDQSYINWLWIIAAISATCAGVVAILYAIWYLKKYIKDRFAPPTTAAVMYFDTAMALAMAELIPAAGIVADENNNIVFVNRQLTEILHWRKDEMIGKKLEMMIPPLSRARHNEGMRQWREQGISEMFNKPMQMHCLMKGDIEIPVEITIKEMIVHDKPFVVGKIRDLRSQIEYIEEVKRECSRENELLRKQVEFFKEIERESGAGMMKWLYSKDRVLMSPGMQSLFSLFQPECLTADTTNRLIVDDRENVANAVVAAVEDKATNGYQISFRLVNGKHISIGAKIKRNKDGMPLIVYGVIHEIGEV